MKLKNTFWIVYLVGFFASLSWFSYVDGAHDNNGVNIFTAVTLSSIWPVSGTYITFAAIGRMSAQHVIKGGE